MMLPAQADGSGDAAFQFGAVAGSLLPVVFLLLALRSAKDEDRSRKCALSIILLMGGWAAASLSYALSRILEAPGLSFVGGVVAVPLFLAAAVLAILGLLEVKASRSPLRGTWQAMTALVLFAVFGIVAIAVGSGGRKIPEDWKLPQAIPGSRIFVNDRYYSLEAPGNDWVQVIPGKLSPRADLAFVHQKKSIILLVLSVPVPAGAILPVDRFVEAARGELKQLDPGAEVGPAEPRTVGTMAGHYFTASARVKGLPVTYCQWLTVQPRSGYQLVAWGPTADAALINSELTRITSGFEASSR